jgi:hypothetical protein
MMDVSYAYTGVYHSKPSKKSPDPLPFRQAAFRALQYDLFRSYGTQSISLRKAI